MLDASGLLRKDLRNGVGGCTSRRPLRNGLAGPDLGPAPQAADRTQDDYLILWRSARRSDRRMALRLAKAIILFRLKSMMWAVAQDVPATEHWFIILQSP